ncbi:hypothetical protein TNCT_358771 [Trichonephila clavata]|uniref:Uncharacterized protein n=1 Tax=Trichonephila clavata TaxID=2740835 RepID=A0A8X6KXB3_TRICU|nr:hypothetical protein TNCT_358771 [Trichonephila clavata]
MIRLNILDKMESVYKELIAEIESNRLTSLDKIFKKFENVKEDDIVDFSTMTIISKNNGIEKFTNKSLERIYKKTEKNEIESHGPYSTTSKGRKLMEKIACHIRSGGKLNEGINKESQHKNFDPSKEKDLCAENLSSRSEVKNSTVSCIFSNKPEFTTDRNDLVSAKRKGKNSTVSCVFSNKPEFTTDRNDLVSSKSKVKNSTVSCIFSNKPEFTTDRNDLVSSKRKVKNSTASCVFSSKPELTTDRNNLDTLSRYINPLLQVCNSKSTDKISNTDTPVKEMTFYTSPSLSSFYKNTSISSIADDHVNDTNALIYSHKGSLSKKNIPKKLNALTHSSKSKFDVPFHKHSLPTVNSTNKKRVYLTRNRRKSFQKRTVQKEFNAIHDDKNSGIKTSKRLENFKLRHPEIKLVESSVFLKHDTSRNENNCNKPIHNNPEVCPLSVPTSFLDDFMLNHKTVSQNYYNSKNSHKSRHTLPVINCRKNDEFSIDLTPKRDAPLFTKKVIFTSFHSKCYNVKHKTVPGLNEPV